MRLALVTGPLLDGLRAKGGATFNAHGRQLDPGERWLCPLHPGKTLILAASADWEAPLRRFVEEHRPLLERDHPEWRAFGAWIHPEGSLYLDIVTGRFGQEDARRGQLRWGRGRAARWWPCSSLPRGGR